MEIIYSECDYEIYEHCAQVIKKFGYTIDHKIESQYFELEWKPKTTWDSLWTHGHSMLIHIKKISDGSTLLMVTSYESSVFSISRLTNSHERNFINKVSEIVENIKERPSKIKYALESIEEDARIYDVKYL